MPTPHKIAHARPPQTEHYEIVVVTGLPPCLPDAISALHAEAILFGLHKLWAENAGDRGTKDQT